MQNAAIDLLHQQSHQNWQVPVSRIKDVYKYVSLDCELWPYLLEAITSISRPDKVLSDENDAFWPREALKELARLVWKKDGATVTKDEFAKWDMCKYRVHEEGVRCVKRGLSGLRPWHRDREKLA